MIRYWGFYAFTCAAAANVALPAVAQNDNCTVPVARAGLYLDEGGAPPSKLPRQAKIEVGAFPRDLHLDYKMPAGASPPHAGIVAVKISRTPNPSNANATVRIRRDPYPYVCGTRDVVDVFNFGNFLGRVYATVDNEVPVADYIFYHKTTSDFRQVALYNFHVYYRDRNGSCVRTDDKKNGNREQFLYDERKRENQLIAQQLYESAALAAKAIAKGTPGERYTQDVANKIEGSSEIHALSAKYASLGRLETQIHSYSDNHGCIPIEISEARSGQSVTITVNDLERRDWHGRRLEGTWTLAIE
jgi:hypothetical protein